MAFGPGGTHAAGYSGRVGSGVVLLGAKGERLRADPIEVKEGRVTSVAFGPGSIIAAGYWRDNLTVYVGGVVLLGAKGERLRADPIEIKEGGVTSVAFGPGGTVAAGYSRDVDGAGGVVLLGAKGERLQADPIGVRRGGVTSVAFGPEGTIAAGYSRGGGVRSVYIGPEDTTAGGYSGGVVGAVVLLHAKGEQLRAAPIEVKEGGATSVAFGPGGIIAAGCFVGVVLLDAKGERLRADPIKVKVKEGWGWVTSVAFGPGGAIAAGYSRDVDGVGGVVLLDGDPASWRGKAEQVANRNFTWKEWRQFFPDTPYRRTIHTLPWPYDLPDSERKRAESAENDLREGDVGP